MSDGAISQDEIDALLSGVDMGVAGGASSGSSVSFDTTVLETFAEGIKVTYNKSSTVSSSPTCKFAFT